MLRFDANLRWVFTEVPMLDRYEAAARAGFKGVEVALPYDTPAAEIASRLRHNGLELVQILTPLDWAAGERGIAVLPDRVEDFRKSVRTAIDYAVTTGCKRIHPLPGNVPNGIERQRCYDTMIGNLAYAADEAGKAGLTVIIEPVCRARFPDFIIKRFEEGAQVIREVGRDNLRLCFDTFHVQMEEGDVSGHLEQYFGIIGHMQIGNTPGRNEPGAGELHFPFLFEQIERLGWPGWIGCEFTPSGHTLDCLDWGAPYGIKPPAGHQRGPSGKVPSAAERAKKWT